MIKNESGNRLYKFGTQVFIVTFSLNLEQTAHFGIKGNHQDNQDIMLAQILASQRNREHIALSIFLRYIYDFNTKVSY